MLDRPRPEFFDQVFEGNYLIEARQHQVKADFDRGYPCTVLGDNFGNGLSNFFPLFLCKKVIETESSCVVRETPDLFADGVGSGDGQPVPNLTPFARDYVARLGAQPEDLFFHIVALLHAPAYRSENAGALRQDWPRVPLPLTADILRDVPAAVWSYTLGGYQVLKKWLTYREAVLLHRPLTPDEALDFTRHVRRIAALLALHPDLDAHYRRAAGPEE